MQTTASLPPGRVRAFMEQRIRTADGFTNRLEALQAASRAKSWDALRAVLAATHIPIEDDLGWSPPPKDDYELDYEEWSLFTQHRQAEALRGLNRM